MTKGSQTSFRFAALVAATLWLIVSIPAAAQLPGTLFGQIFDENGDPVVGVKIVVTDPEMPSFKQETESGKNGRYSIMFKNSLPAYHLEFSKEGYQSFSLGGVKVAARQRTRKNFDIKSAEAAVASAAESGDADAAKAIAGAGNVFNQGVAAFNAEQYDVAEESFLQALEKDADLAEANAALARVYRVTDQHEKAIEQANLAIAADKSVDDMNQVLFDAHSALGNEAEAQAALAKLQTGDPAKASQNLFNQAAEAFNAGDMDTAKSTLDKVLELNPDHAKANYLLGVALVGEDPARAKTLLEKFIALAPNDPDAATAKEMMQYLQ